ncbi:hypothetical protein BO221_49260 [Archangium sp. Cb G35]|nr:hypothetical protein BO221_49260 [Archangium sp. Cb G35]
MTWSMDGNHNFIGKAVGMFMDMDNMLGADIEKGLAQLKTVAEGKQVPLGGGVSWDAGPGGPGVKVPGLVGGAEAQPSAADCSAAWFSALQTSEDASSWRDSPCITRSSIGAGATQVASQEEGMYRPQVVSVPPMAQGSPQHDAPASQISEHCSGRAEADSGARKSRAVAASRDFSIVRMVAPFGWGTAAPM